MIQLNWAGFISDVPRPRLDKISRHASLLLKSGLLSRHANGRFVQWHVRLDIEELARQRIEAWALAKASPPYNHLRIHGQASIDDLSTALGPSWPLQRTQAELMRLYAFGVLDRTRDQFVMPCSRSATATTISAREPSAGSEI